ncbi:hypothetical protein NDU88_010484 [Pleurodeles waltl]|uniref:Uncharacterized protein n=1 Tax=Pleurodeles waltl TaxID=8319 RepID=A0AAV7S0T8_PLEWA|nr:hypothetical protein NDU88_010484 [Pleurodeles waltl]
MALAGGIIFDAKLRRRSFASKSINMPLNFYQIARFPHVRGAIDETHVAIYPPSVTERQCLSRAVVNTDALFESCNAS